MYDTWCNAPASVIFLLLQGADMNAKDKDGHTARSLAYNKHHVRTVTLLDNAVFIYRRMSGEPYYDELA